VLGDHATQKGSLVAPDRLRFDYSHFAPLSDAEKQTIEDLVNAEVRSNADTATEVLGIDEAKKRGAMHMFGEKYGEKVRVVRIGGESLEFCGGTHVRRAGDIGLFKIVSEAGIAQGVRRIEAVTGAGALAYVQRLESDLARTAGLLRRSPQEVPAAVDKLLVELRAREKEIAELKRKLAIGGGGSSRDIMGDVREIAGVRVLATKTDIADPKALRELGDQLRDKLKSGVLVLAGVAEGKVSIVAMVTKDLVGKLDARKIAGMVAEVVGGRGGGRVDMAQGAGSDPSKVDQALEKVFEFVAAAN
jgi:alanyl-tRNA synthetase